MKKKIVLLLSLLLILGLINTFFTGFLLANELSEGKMVKSLKPSIVISKDYDKGQSLEKAYATGKPVIVWFYADWCGYCQKFAPTFKKFTNKKIIKENFAIAYVNTENPNNEKYMRDFEVQGIPSVFALYGMKKIKCSSYELFIPKAERHLEEKFMEFIGK